ncbi:DUF6599 family protein [Gemmatimonadota bacterium]
MSRFIGNGFSGTIVLCILAVLAACGGNQSSGGDISGTTAALLPAENLPGGSLSEGEAQLYQGRELFDYSDGGADLYLEFGFVEAAVREYKSPVGDDITAVVYRMEDPEAAFGVFSIIRRGAFTPRKMGAMGARSEFEYIFCHGDFFVQVQSTGQDTLTARVVDEISAKIDSELEGGSTDWPKALSLLPRRGFVPHSEVYFEGPLALNSRRFISDKNLFALSDSIPGAMASFMVRDGGHPAIYLVIEYPDSAFSRRVFDSLEEFYQNTADQDRDQDANVQFKTGDDRIIYSNARKMDAIVLRGVHLTALFENIAAGHGGNPHGGGAGEMMSPHGGGAPGGMANPHGGVSPSKEQTPNPHGTN